MSVTLLLAPLLLISGVRKAFLWLRGIIFFILSNEKKGLSCARDAGRVKVEAGSESKTIIFVRHGESDWNFIFHKNICIRLIRIVTGLVREARMFFTEDSVFIDSPLSEEGVDQAKSLQDFLQVTGPVSSDTHELHHEALSCLRGDIGAQPSVLVTSNLRRAIHTGCIALWPRLQRTNEKIHILSCLQEITKATDAYAMAGRRQVPEMSTVEETLGKDFDAVKLLDASENAGSKAVGSRALDRMEEFCDWCFRRPEQVIIVSAGHSLWFQNFFKTYIAKAEDHEAKTRKMVNCGAVAFKLHKGVVKELELPTGYRIKGESVTSLYGGFEAVRK